MSAVSEAVKNRLFEQIRSTQWEEMGSKTLRKQLEAEFQCVLDKDSFMAALTDVVATVTNERAAGTSGAATDATAQSVPDSTTTNAESGGKNAEKPAAKRPRAKRSRSASDAVAEQETTETAPPTKRKRLTKKQQTREMLAAAEGGDENTTATTKAKPKKTTKKRKAADDVAEKANDDKGTNADAGAAADEGDDAPDAGAVEGADDTNYAAPSSSDEASERGIEDQVERALFANKSKRRSRDRKRRDAAKAAAVAASTPAADGAAAASAPGTAAGGTAGTAGSAAAAAAAAGGGGAGGGGDAANATAAAAGGGAGAEAGNAAAANTADSDGDDDDDAKKTKKKKKKKRAKKVRADADDDASGDAGESKRAGKEPKVKSEAQKILDSLKRSKGSKSSVSHEEKLEQVKSFIERMEAAAYADRAAAAAHNTALAKLAALEQFVTTLAKVHLHTLLVDNNVLGAVKLWLEPSNGALPSVNVRTRLLEALQQLPCGRDHLIESGIGKTIMLLWKHPDETKHNRDLCAALVERWSRPIFELNNDYSALAPATFDVSASIDAGADTTRRATSLTGGGSFVDVARADERIELHPLTGRVRRPKVRVPQPLRLNFDMQPASKIEQRAISVPSDKKKVMVSHLNSLKKKKSNFKRAEHVAISKLNL